MVAFLTSPEAILVFRLVIALVLGALIGVERTIAHKKAGIRTYALVAMGSALFVIAGEMVRMNTSFDVDPLRIASQVVMGVGFLGAGLIIFHREVQGLTTAAGLWVAAGVGVAVGFGLYLLALAAVILTLFILIILWSFELEVKEIVEPGNGHGS